MNNVRILFIFVVFLMGCDSFAATDNIPPETPAHDINTRAPEPTSEPTAAPAVEPITLTPAQDIDTQVLEPTSEPTAAPAEEPIAIDFGGKAVYTQLHFDGFEAEELLPGLDFSDYGDAVVTADFNDVIDGKHSIRLSRFGHLITNPDVLPFESNATYLVDFDYRILDRGNESDTIMSFLFQPIGENSDNQELWVSTFDLLPNAEEHGAFTLGAKMGNAPIYRLTIQANEEASVVIDNIRVIRQDVRAMEHQPTHWENILSLPYPRLGGYAQGTTNWIAHGIGGEPQFSYSVNQIEQRLAMFDVLVGSDIRSQTIDPGFTYRLRKMNPNIIILPYRIAQEEEYELPLAPLYENATEDIIYDFQLGLADDWFVRDTNGNLVTDPDWDAIRKMNISEYSPVVNGQTFNDYLIDWILNDILAKGHWDGIFFDNLFGDINPHITNYSEPALLDYDINLNGLRDETPALVSETTRRAAAYLLEQLRGEVGDLEIIIGNTGPHPEIHLAQYVNGFTFECVNEAWDSEWLPEASEAGWRLILQEYFILQAENVSPVINILEGCGRKGNFVEADHVYLEPTDEDIRIHRFSLGTTLLGDGFYEYDLFDARSAPYWFDEYTVNQDGVAEEAPENRGYLGYPLGDAVELQVPAVTVWEEDFESGTMSDELWTSTGVYIGQDPGEVVNGRSSLVMDNPDHTQSGYISTSTDYNQLSLLPNETYVVEFDWRIIESLDGNLATYIWDGSTDVSAYIVPGVVAGDSGTARFPSTLGASSNYRLSFDMIGGGGKVAIDNIRVTEGGAGPWRRDFENGFVLVNPLNRPYTFTMDELTGAFGRTGIKRILGTQAPDVNNGLPVTESLTLQPFDAIILLADFIPFE